MMILRLNLFLILGFLPLAQLFANDPFLIPVEVEEEGWVRSPEIGWCYALSPSEEGVWFWLPHRSGDGMWIFSSVSLYPWYWNRSEQAWESIERETGITGRTYKYNVERDQIVGKTFKALEAYAGTEAPPGMTFKMSPSVHFREDGLLEFFYSDVGIIGYWALMNGTLFTNSKAIGDNLRYNPETHILIIDHHKYQAVGSSFSVKEKESGSR